MNQMNLKSCLSRTTERDVEKKYRDRFVLTDKHDYEQQENQKVNIIDSDSSFMIMINK